VSLGGTIQRLKPDWSLDPVFSPVLLTKSGGGAVAPSGWGLGVDGRLLVAGNIRTVRVSSGREYTVNGIARINGDNALPLLITGLPSSQTKAQGASVTFSATVVGYPAPTLRWQFEGVDIPGATNAALVLTNLVASQSGSYRLVASNALETALSEAAILTVLVAPQIAKQPQPQQVVLGGTASFDVLASGSEPLGYQWKRDNSVLAGETSQVLTITNVQAYQSGSYSVVVSNAAGFLLSVSAHLTVLQPPFFISFQPRSQVVYVGSTLTRKSHQWGGRSIPDSPRARFPGL